MRCFVSSLSFVCFLSVIVLVKSAPFLPAQTSASLQLGGGGTSGSAPSNGGGLGDLTSILSQIDLPGLLRGVNSFVKLVGVFCPPLSQVLDNVIQNVTSTAFRVFGRAILQSGGLGGGSSSSGGGGQRVSVVLPTFPPDDEDDFDDEEDDNASTTTMGSLDIDVKALSNNVNDNAKEDTTEKETSTTVSSGFNKNTETSSTAELYTSSPDNVESNIIKRHSRVTREVEAIDDQQVAESAPEPQDLSDVDVDDQDRDKRYTAFGGTAEGHGGSGNFLFDIIRSTADRAARAVGTVYRMVAGTENLGLQSATGQDSPRTGQEVVADQSAPEFQLVAGSGATEEVDEKEAAPGVLEVDVHKASETEGVPGPITRLFVIANRGIANLVQDLILRLAQTSEKLVNFKARLITSLI